MAIQKTKTLPNGAQGNYWKITSIAIDRQASKIDAKIALFKDKATSDAGAPALGAIKHFSFPCVKSELSADVVELCYIKIMAIASAIKHVDISGAPIVPGAAVDADIADGIAV